MKDPFEMKGIWWLPDNPEKKLTGTLSFSQDDGLHLEIIGVFGEKFIIENEHNPIIYGVSQPGKPVTLYKCFITHKTSPITGLGKSVYRVHFAFEGVHFEREEDIKFHQLCGSYTDLDAWVNIYGFEINQEEDDGEFVWNIKFARPQPHIYNIENDLEAGISFGYKGPNSSIVQTDVKISQRANLCIKSNQKDILFEELFGRLNTFTYLIQIATQGILYPLTIFGLSHKNARTFKNDKKYLPPINIYFQPIEAFRNQKQKIPQEMLFTFNDLEEAQIVQWFQSFEKYKTVIHLYGTLFYNDRLFIENRFLNIAQALESLHSILFNNQNLPYDEFISRKERILQDTPEDLQEWVKEALSNANYKRFRKKILELLTNKKDIIGYFVDDFDHFSKRVMHTRNEFVHHNKRKWSFQRGEELVLAIDILTILFEAYVLEIICFSEDKVKELLDAKIKTRLSGWKTLRSMKKK
ncbi:HEPN domain-containing protein [Chloroflexota bacterium]